MSRRVTLAACQPVWFAGTVRTMSPDMGHRKQVRHYDEPGHCHEWTFSCYRRMLLLTNDVWRSMLSVSVGGVVAGESCDEEGKPIERGARAAS